MPGIIAWSARSWPALLVGLILLTYWLRVLYMVRRTKQQTRHGANLVPPEKLGRWLRLLWAPVVALWVVVPLITAIFQLETVMLRPLYCRPIIQAAALIIAAVAFVLTWACWINMGRSWRMGIDPGEKTELVFTGPFAYVRNPIYGLSSVLMFMTVLIVPSPLMIMLGVLHVLLLQWEVRREERYLSMVHGAVYDDYRSRVGRFLPRSLRAYRRTAQ